ncbi:MAG: S8 family peptidase [Chthoniobacteraceae bacterium]
MPDFPHRHLQISPERQALNFSGNGRGKFKRRSNLTREQHAARLQQQMSSVENAFTREHDRREQTAEPTEDFGLILNIKSAPNYPLKLDSLDKAPSRNNDGIYLLNVRRERTRQGVVTHAAILVPFGQLKTLVGKIAAYADPAKDSTNARGERSPRNADLLANIDLIAVAALDALWMESDPLPPPNEMRWWELWVSRTPRAGRANRSWVQIFNEATATLGLEVNQFRLRLPENEVVLVKARRNDLESSLEILNTLTEVRKLHPCSIDLSDLSGPEQHDWITEALDRVSEPSASAPAVCLLDTGVNRLHPLLQNVLAETDIHTVIPQFGMTDHHDSRFAHGTQMAGIAVYDDLRGLMLSTTSWNLLHRLESVKLIHEGDEHHPANYGAVTQEAMARPEVNAPHRQRVYCLAITQGSFIAKGQPSAWSAAIDASAAGVGEGDAKRRMVFVSAGNQRDFLNYGYPTSNHQSSIENPAQAWNAVTVGAHTKLCTISESDPESRTGACRCIHWLSFTILTDES